MRRKRLPLLLLLVCALVSAAFPQRRNTPPRTTRPAPQRRPPAASPARDSAGQAVKSYKEIKYPPLGKLNIPQPARFELPNGMVVYLLEDRTLPMVNVSAMIRTGWRLEPVNKAGLAAITGEVMRTGGTRTRSGDELDEELDRLGGYVETGIGEDSGVGFVSVLKEDTDRGLAILADVLRNPKFPDDKIELSKIGQRDFISRRNDDPTGIAFREFNRVLYGKDSPYAKLSEYRTIKAIDRDDIVNFHKQYFQPENIILGAWGDFNAAEMRAQIERTFGSWPRGGRPRPAVPEIEAAARTRSGIYFINKEDVNQSWVIIGGLGGRRDDPDFYALSVTSTILGGGFASRLFSRVRSQLGLAYSVWSDWGAGWDRPGSFTAVGGTKSETTVKMLNSIRQEISTLAASGVSDDELARAKDSILKGFAFEFDSTGKVVRRIMSYEYFGYPADYLQRYAENIQKVTREDVQRVARQHLQSERFLVLVLGREKDFDQPLSTLGQVTPIDVTIPPEDK
jgi:zinc protease